MLKTLTSDRMVTGIAWFAGGLWHGGRPAGFPEGAASSELSRVDTSSGTLLERIPLPEGTPCSGLDVDADGRFWCGDPSVAHVRAVTRTG